MERTKWILVVRWTARIWSLVPIFFALAEILFPHDGGAQIFWYEYLSLGLLGVILIGLAIAWRWERLGAWISLSVLAIFSIVLILTVDNFFPMIIIFLLALGIPAGMFFWVAEQE